MSDDLELQVAYLERTLEKHAEALLEHERRIDELQKVIERLEARQRGATEADESPRWTRGDGRRGG